MQKSIILLALLIAVISLGSVMADDNVTGTNTTSGAESNITNATNSTEIVNDNNIAAGSDIANNTNTTSNATNSTQAAGEPLNNTLADVDSEKMLETGLPIVALLTVALLGVGAYRRK